MARFYDEIGYGETVESPVGSGVYIDQITKVNLYGDVIREARKLEESGEKLNNDVSVVNRISVVADEYANNHFHLIKYVKWMGTRWTVSNVEVLHPRLILSLGKVYNGPT